MEISDFLSKFKEQLIDGKEVNLTIDDDFRKTDSYDSLTGMAILVMIKDEFRIDITDNEYKSIHSVSELFEFINTKL